MFSQLFYILGKKLMKIMVFMRKMRIFAAFM